MEDRKNEWRHFFTPQVRQEVVKKLFAMLKNQLHFSDPTPVNKAESIAANFEKNMFHTATTKEDYINKINKKMMDIADSSSSGPTETSMVNAVGQRGQQMNFSKKQPNSLCLQNTSISFHQPESMAASQSNVWNSQQHQCFIDIPKLAAFTPSQHKSQRTSQPIHVHQQHDSEKQSISSQDGLQSIVDCYKGLTSQQVLPEALKAPSQSTALPRTENAAAWHDQAYQELQSLRGICLPYLMENLGRAYNICVQKERDSVQLGKYKRDKLNIEQMINFLLLSRSDIEKFSKENFNRHQQIIEQYCHLKRKNSVSVPEHAQLHPPATRSQIPFPLQSRNVNPQLQPNMMSTSSPSGSQRGIDKRNMSNSYPRSSASSSCQNVVGLPQQRSFTQKTSVNAHDPAIFPLQPQKQGIEMKKPQMPMQNIHEVPIPHNHEQPPVSPPWTSQHSFSRIDKQNLLSLSKAGTVLQSMTSTITTAYPTPSTPSSSPLDFDKHPHPAGVSPLSDTEHIPHSQTNAKADNPTNTQFHAIKMPIMESPATENGNQQPSTKMEPIKRLCRVVASMSPRALLSAVKEIGSVMNMVDIIDESRVAVDGILTSQICETEITATPWMKRRKV